MNILFLGVILLVGYLLAAIVEKFGFPKIVGYLAAGLLLNPGLTDFIPTNFISNINSVINFCLAFITFEIGSSFSLAELRTTGKKFFKLAFFESFGAFVLIGIGFFIIATYFLPFSGAGISVIIAFALLLASLAAPTDPSATLAIIHENKAKGPVTNTILGAAAFDDIVTLILFSFSLSISRSILGENELSFFHISYLIVYKIGGAVLTGIVFGFIFNKTTDFFKVEDKKSLIIVFLAFLSLTFGLASYLNLDELFSTLTLGFVIRNYNKAEEQIISITEQGLEDLFFLIFFVFSAMHFNIQSVQLHLLILIAGFILIRGLGKYIGMYFGTRLLKMPAKVKQYAFGGLIPQGGIVLGLALVIAKEPEFKDFSNLLVGIIMGATIIHEFLGPVVSRFVLRKAGEVNN